VVSGVFLYLVPLERVTSGEAFAAQAGAALFGPAGGQVFAAIVVVSVAGSLSVLLMALPRVYYAMARDGLFFSTLGTIHPRFGTPARAIVLQAVLASVLAALGTFDQILAYFIFVTVLFLGLTALGLAVLRRRGRRGPTPAPGYPVTLGVFLTMVVVLLVLLAARSPREVLLGVLVVSLGIPVYRLARFR